MPLPPSQVSTTGPQFLLKFSDSTGANFTTLAKSKDIKGPSSSMGKVDVTTQDAANKTRLYDPELVDPGVLSTDILYSATDSTHQALIAAYQAGSFLNFQLYNNPPTNSKYISGSGFFTKFEPTHPVAGSLTASIEFQISDKWTQN